MLLQITGRNNFLCPPISLIGSTIRYLRLCKASGTLVIPVCPSAYFWPIIFPNGVISNFVTDLYVFEPIYNSPYKDSVFNGFAHFKTIALNIEFQFCIALNVSFLKKKKKRSFEH